MDNKNFDVIISGKNSSDIEKYSKIEITDNKVLGQLNGFIPKLVNIAQNTIAASRNTFEVILPAGFSPSDLVKSKNTEGAFRAIVQGTNGQILSQAELMPISNAMNIISSVMSAASIIVGQYYLSQINKQLGEVNSKLNEILESIENESKAVMFRLMVELENISKFKYEIFQDEDELKRTLIKLEDFDSEAMDQLFKINLKLETLSSAEVSNYDIYIEKITEIERWSGYQKAFYNIIYIIAELKYVLSRGSYSRERSNHILQRCLSKCVETNTKIAKYGEKLIDKQRKKARDATMAKYNMESAGYNLMETSFDIGSYIMDNSKTPIGALFGFATSIAGAAINLVPSLISIVGSGIAEAVENDHDDKIHTMEDRRKAVCEGLSAPNVRDIFNEQTRLISDNGKLYYITGENHEGDTQK